MFMVDSTLKFVEFLSSGKYLLDFFQKWEKSSFSVRISLNIILSRLFQKLRGMEMARKIEKVELDADMMVSLIRRLYAERRRLRSF